MKTLESFFSRTAQFGLLIYLTGCFGLLIVLGAAVAKWLKLIDVIQYIAFAFGLGSMLTALLVLFCRVMFVIAISTIICRMS